MLNLLTIMAQLLSKSLLRVAIGAEIKVGESLQQCAGANSAPLRFIFLLLRKITS